MKYIKFTILFILLLACTGCAKIISNNTNESFGVTPPTKSAMGGLSSWQQIWTNTLTPTNTAAGIFVNASSTINSNFRVSGNATTTGSFSAGQLLVNNTPLNIVNWDTAYNRLATTTPDYIIATTTNGLVYSYRTSNNSVVSSNALANVVLQETMANATSTGMHGADIYVKPGTYYLNATTTFYGLGTNSSNTWKLHGAGQDQTRFVVNDNSTAFHLTKYVKVDFRNFSIYLTDGETGITAKSHDGYRSVWNSIFDSLYFAATTTDYYGTAILFGNDFRNTYNNIQFIGIPRCIRSYAEGTVDFHNGDSLYQNMMCTSGGNTLSGTIAYDFEGLSNEVVNQNVFNMVNAFANLGSKTAWKLTRADRFLATGVGIEGFSTTTELYNSDNNSFKYFYVIASTTPSVYFKTDVNSQDNSFNNNYVDSYSGTHYLFKDSNSTNARPNIVQGVDNSSFGTYGSGIIKNATTTASIIRDWNKNGNVAFDQIKISGNKLLIDAASGGNQFIIGNATSTLTNGIVIDTSTLVVNSNENRVGIGIANPVTLLNLHDPAATSPANTQLWLETISTNASVSSGASSGGIGIKLQHDIDGSANKWAGILANAEDTFSNAVGLSFYTGGVTVDTPREYMRLTSAGKLCLRCTSATSTLNVVGSALISTNATTSGYMVIGTTNPTINMAAGDLLMTRATTTNLYVSHLTVGNVLNLPANSVTDAMVSNTLTCSDLQAASEVVADSEVVDALTINTSIEGIFTGNARINKIFATSSIIDSLRVINATSTNSFDAKSYCINGSSCIASWPSGTDYGAAWQSAGTNIITPTTTNAGILVNAASSTITMLNTNYASSTRMVIGSTQPNINFTDGLFFNKATGSSLAITGLSAASCDVKSTTDGVLYCGTDSTGVGSDYGAAWDQIWSGAIKPTTSNTGIFVNASSTINSTLRVTGAITAVGGVTGNLTGNVTGNADTASALAATPGGCSANQWAYAIEAAGDLTCRALTRADIPITNGAWQTIWTNALAPTSTAAGIFVYASSTFNSTLRINGAATSTNLGVASLAVASCDVKATTAGDLYCGTDATGTVNPSAGMWETVAANIIRPTSTAAGILINSASSTVTNLVSNNASSTRMVIGSTQPTFNFSSGLFVDYATTTAKIVIGTVNPTNGSVLFVTGNGTFSGGLTMNSATTTDSFAVGGVASSTGYRIKDNFIYNAATENNNLATVTATTTFSTEMIGTQYHGMKVVPGYPTTTLEFY